jgi:hypothetical protein
MHDTPNPTMAPPHVLAALLVPRADQVWAMAAWSRAVADPWRGKWVLTPFEIAALRRRAKERSTYLREAFAHLRADRRGAHPPSHV